MRILTMIWAALSTVCWACAAEIQPTPEMLARAERANCISTCDEQIKYEYHFRDINGHVLWCAHAQGGNGNFCSRISNTQIASTDHAATTYCQSSDSVGYPTPPHAVYGELWDLDYRCVGHDMTRLATDMALDGEGYVRTQWKVLP